MWAEILLFCCAWQQKWSFVVLQTVIPFPAARHFKKHETGIFFLLLILLIGFTYESWGQNKIQGDSFLSAPFSLSFPVVISWLLLGLWYILYHFPFRTQDPTVWNLPEAFPACPQVHTKPSVPPGSADTACSSSLHAQALPLPPTQQFLHSFHSLPTSHLSPWKFIFPPMPETCARGPVIFTGVKSSSLSLSPPCSFLSSVSLSPLWATSGWQSVMCPKGPPWTTAFF